MSRDLEPFEWTALGTESVGVVEPHMHRAAAGIGELKERTRGDDVFCEDELAGEEREARINEVLRELKLDIHKEKKVTSLSGGQRKRVSVALELLTKPSLIFLDEPTSGLDPGMDRDVMQLLRGLADDGRTVLVVTHSVAELASCDKLLVMAPGGSVAYFGPPEEALNFFGYSTWADVFSAFENYRDYDWAGRWRGSQHYQMYAADIDAVAAQSVHMPSPQQMRPPKPQSCSRALPNFTCWMRSLCSGEVPAKRTFFRSCGNGLNTRQTSRAERPCSTITAST